MLESSIQLINCLKFKCLQPDILSKDSLLKASHIVFWGIVKDIFNFLSCGVFFHETECLFHLGQLSTSSELDTHCKVRQFIRLLIRDAIRLF